MGIGEAAILGIIQGLTEFLPISSSGHLTIVEHFFGADTGEEVTSFVVAVHFASLAAIFTVMWRDIVRLLTVERRMLLLIVVATIPVIVLGKFMADPTEAMFEYPIVAGCALLGTALMLFISDHLATEQTEARQARWWEAVIIGLAQVVAMVPGVSRSGMTIGSGLICGLKRQDAIRFSFLMAVPVISIATVYTLYTAYTGQASPGDAPTVDMWPTITGMIASFVFSVLAIRIMLKRVGRTRLSYFAGYCVLVGTTVIVLSIILK